MNEPWPGFRRDFGEALHRERLRKQVTQREAAVRCGISQPALSMYERGQRAVPLAVACLAAEALEIPLPSLMATALSVRFEREQAA